VSSSIPNDPEVIAQARKDGMPSLAGSGRQSPIWKMAMEWKVAFPLHPEYRTLPMVWYVPPLSPIQSAAEAGKIGIDGACRTCARCAFRSSISPTC
jgi:nitrate reductase beta subunit